MVFLVPLDAFFHCAIDEHDVMPSRPRNEMLLPWKVYPHWDADFCMEDRWHLHLKLKLGMYNERSCQCPQTPQFKLYQTIRIARYWNFSVLKSWKITVTEIGPSFDVSFHGVFQPPVGPQNLTWSFHGIWRIVRYLLIKKKKKKKKKNRILCTINEVSNTIGYVVRLLSISMMVQSFLSFCGVLSGPTARDSRSAWTGVSSGELRRHMAAHCILRVQTCCTCTTSAYWDSEIVLLGL